MVIDEHDFDHVATKVVAGNDEKKVVKLQICEVNEIEDRLEVNCAPATAEQIVNEDDKRTTEVISSDEATGKVLLQANEKMNKEISIDDDVTRAVRIIKLFVCNHRKEEVDLLVSEQVFNIFVA